MKFEPMILDAYLDGELPDAQAAEVRNAASADPQVHDLLRRLQTQRALRAAALATYAPDEQTASALTAALLDQVSQPLARIGWITWARRAAAVAAVLAITTGAFFYGRSSAPVQIQTQVSTVVQDHYVVQIVSPTGEATEHVFATREDANDFVAEVQRQQNGTVVAGVF
jgi:anti-sigma factor RsiW